jgi:hypothetical protein
MLNKIVPDLFLKGHRQENIGHILIEKEPNTIKRKEKKTSNTHKDDNRPPPK